MKIGVAETKVIGEMRRDAAELKKEFQEYLEELELFSSPEFWAAVKEAEEGKTIRFKSIEQLKKELDA